MLKELSIQDFATIKSMHLFLGTGLNIVTGETGAGKSLIVDALRAVLGGRMNHHSIRTGAEQLHVQAVFSVSPQTWMLKTEGFLSKTSIYESNNCDLTISRTIRRDGKSTFRLNDKVIPSSWMKRIADCIATIHGQRHQLFLLDPSSHLDVLDNFGGLTVLRADLESAVRRLEAQQANLSDTLEKQRSLASNKDSILAEIEEIESSNITTDEESHLVIGLQTQEHGASILEACANATTLLFNGTENAWDLISQARSALENTPDAEGFLKRSIDLIDSIEAQMSESVQEIRSYSEKVQYSQFNRNYTEQRMSTYDRLKRKYGPSVESILGYAENARADLASLSTSQANVEQLRQLISEMHSHVIKLASNLSQKRIAAASTLEDLVQTELRSVDLSNAKFKVSIHQRAPIKGLPINDVDSNIRGVDYLLPNQVRFLLSANPGEELKPLDRIVSGGEASRIALALNVVLGDLGSCNPIVFDEIDAGVSGRTASTIGKKLSALSISSQILCITHLPQIAAFADHHFLIEKQVHGNNTFSKCTVLNADQQRQEITAMLGVANRFTVSPTALQLLNIANSHKRPNEGSHFRSDTGENIAGVNQTIVYSHQR